jgi:uncharacterized protein (TIGR02147 family)
MKKINIYGYTNFREYLKAFFEKSKKDDRSFSHRYLAQKLELSTPNLILLIMQGKRNLTRRLSQKVSRVCRHTKRERLYFEAMVSFLQAKSHEEKCRYFEKMSEIRKKVYATRMDEWQFKYYKNWYNPVVQELVTDPNFTGSDKWIAKRLSPSISAVKAKGSMKLLQKLGYIRKTGKKFEQSEPAHSPSPEVHSLGMVEFHRNTSKLAAQSLDRHKDRERYISSCTLVIDEKQYQRLKVELDKIRSSSLRSTQKASRNTRVYQLNFQLFPLSVHKKDLRK